MDCTGIMKDVYKRQRQYNAGESNYTRLASLSYNTSGYLTSITDQAGRTTTYTYNSTSQLTTVTHEDGKTVNYTYSAGGKLASASDNEQRYRINYTYTDDRISSCLLYTSRCV